MLARALRAQGASRGIHHCEGTLSVENPTKPRRRGWPAVLGQSVIMPLIGAAIWAAWLGWDHSYYYDAAVGAYQGPYTPWQVIACALTVELLAFLLALAWNPFVVAGGMTFGFWLAWTVQASREDASGLFLVGSIMLLIGLVVGTAIAGVVGYGMRPLLQRLRTR